MSAKAKAADSVRSEPARDLVIARTIDAPRALVFEAWSESKHLAQWWGPSGWTNPVCEVDLRPGGIMKIVMRSADGAEHPMQAVFQEVVVPERIVFITSVSEDERGKAGLEVHNTVMFAEQEGKTTLTMRARVLNATPQVAGALAGMEAGWTQSLERLAVHVANL